MRTRYLPAVNLHDPMIHQAVETGALVLQPGQPVSVSGTTGRFVGVTAGRSLYVAYNEGSAVKNRRRFSQLRTTLARQQAAL